MNKKKLTTALIACFLAMYSYAQVTLFGNRNTSTNPSPILYDSLYNIKSSNNPKLDYLIGQRLFFYKDYNIYGSTKNYLERFYRINENGTTEEIPSKDLVQKYFDVLSIKHINGMSIFELLEISSKERIELKVLGNLDNAHWVVQGYYDKAQKDYIGKTLILSKTSPSADDYNLKEGDYLLKKGNGIFDPTLPKGTEFKCTGISLNTDRSFYGRSPESSNVILFFSNKDFGDYYLYLDRSFNGLRDRKTLDIFLTSEDYQKELSIKEQKEKERITNLKKRKVALIKKYGKVYGNLISQGKVKIGMTTSMCKESWGIPTDINKTIGSFGTYEQWVYGNKEYLYFENGKLTTIQN